MVCTLLIFFCAILGWLVRSVSASDALQMLHPVNQIGLAPALSTVESEGGVVVAVGVELDAGETSGKGPFFNSSQHGGPDAFPPVFHIDDHIFHVTNFSAFGGRNNNLDGAHAYDLIVDLRYKNFCGLAFNQ